MFLFVGEERSELAKTRNVRWEDGALAAKQLFDALRSCGIDPEQQQFTNLFERGGVSKILAARAAGMRIVGTGKKVQLDLDRRRISHLALTHPAARGRIRRKDRYTNHVREALLKD
jgi:hypothetical protein